MKKYIAPETNVLRVELSNHILEISMGFGDGGRGVDDMKSRQNGFGDFDDDEDCF